LTRQRQRRYETGSKGKDNESSAQHAMTLATPTPRARPIRNLDHNGSSAIPAALEDHPRAPAAVDRSDGWAHIACGLPGGKSASTYASLRRLSRRPEVLGVHGHGSAGLAGDRRRAVPSLLRIGHLLRVPADPHTGAWSTAGLEAAAMAASQLLGGRRLAARVSKPRCGAELRGRSAR
jgi:hypothetical protein